MNRKIVRSYHFTEREVHEALICWMRAQDLQQPSYVANTESTKWTRDQAGGVTVEWADEDQVEVST